MATTITTWTSLLNPFLGIFTQPGRVIFVRLTVGWILCTVRRTVTGMLPFADPAGTQAHDAYHRFFPDARWCMDNLWQQLMRLLVATFCRTGLIELAQQMINDVLQWFPERRFKVVGDGFYTSLAGKKLARTTIISRIQCNAEIYDLPTKPKRKKKGEGRPRTKGKRLASPEKMAPRVKNWRRVEVCERGQMRTRLVYTQVILWYRVLHQPILLVISRDPKGKEKDDFLFCTDVTMDPATVIGDYADRWAIEDTFKNTKQFMGGQQPQTYKGQGPERAAGLSLWLYSMVWLWYLLQKSNKRTFMVPPWNPYKSTPSFADALRCLRRELWTERIKHMFGISAVHDENYEFLIEALAAAA